MGMTNITHGYNVLTRFETYMNRLIFCWSFHVSFISWKIKSIVESIRRSLLFRFTYETYMHPQWQKQKPSSPEIEKFFFKMGQGKLFVRLSIRWMQLLSSTQETLPPSMLVNCFQKEILVIRLYIDTNWLNRSFLQKPFHDSVSIANGFL